MRRLVLCALVGVPANKVRGVTYLINASQDYIEIGIVRDATSCVRGFREKGSRRNASHLRWALIEFLRRVCSLRKRLSNLGNLVSGFQISVIWDLPTYAPRVGIGLLTPHWCVRTAQVSLGCRHSTWDGAIASPTTTYAACEVRRVALCV